MRLLLTEVHRVALHPGMCSKFWRPLGGCGEEHEDSSSKRRGLCKAYLQELLTVLMRIEACLNSRPLVLMLTNNQERVEALTRGHFLIGQPLNGLPEPDETEENIYILCHWTFSHHIARHFWRRRQSEEYITSLNKFYKWKHPCHLLQTGDW